MAKLNLPPTKSTYLQLRSSMEFVTEGRELLEQKRQILLMELMAQVEAARRAEREVLERMQSAYQALDRALAEGGSLRLGALAIAARARPELSLGERRIMGITLSEVQTRIAQPRPQFGLGEPTAAIDTVVQRFHAALEAISRLAEVENIVYRLARELRKTQRRVNALDKIFIPDYSETLKYIASALEEREREGVVVMRMAKSR